MPRKKKTEEMIEETMETKPSKAPIPPDDDMVQVIPGMEAFVEEYGEVQADMLSYKDGAGRIRVGHDDAYAYRCIPVDVGPDRQMQIASRWRGVGYSEVTGIICEGMPGRVFRTTKKNAEKISEAKAAAAVRARQGGGDVAGLGHTKVDYFESQS